MGSYALLGRIGAGGMGRVYLGRSLGGRLVAVKVIHGHLAADAEFRVRFAREVQAAQRVSGVFTAPVIDSDANAPLPWLATGYVHGPSLSASVASHGALPTPSVLTLAAGLAEGLNAVHAAGVVHRDLKPSNVLLAQDGPRLIDFGISQASGHSPLTRTGIVLGTPGFMSPEQAEGLTVGPASDIFSLGAVLLFADTGKRMAFFAPHLERLSRELRPLVARCMAMDPAERPSAGEFLAEVIGAHPGAADQTDWLPEGILPTGTSPLSPRSERTPVPEAPAPGTPAPGTRVPGTPAPGVPLPEPLPRPGRRPAPAPASAWPPEPSRPEPSRPAPSPSVPPAAPAAPVLVGPEPQDDGVAGRDSDRVPLASVTMQDAWARTRTSITPTPVGLAPSGPVPAVPVPPVPAPPVPAPPVPPSRPGWEVTSMAIPPPGLQPPLTLASPAPEPRFVETAPFGRPRWWRRRRVAWVAAGAAVVLAAGGCVYVIGPWRTAPLLRPTGLATVERTPNSIDLGWSGPPSGPRPDTYVILRDGAKVATVPGSSTSFDDTGLPPASPHGYRVIAYRGSHRSKSSAQLSTATVTPPAADGVLDSAYSVSEQLSDGDPYTTAWWEKQGSLYEVESNGTWTDGWSFSPDSANCDVGPCEVTLTGTLDGAGFTMDLSQSGGSYSGSVSIDNDWYCYSNNEYSDATLQIQLTPQSASAQGMSWQAQSFDATVTWTIPSDAAGACTAAAFTADGSGAPS
jgi:hypothetical protein